MGNASYCCLIDLLVARRHVYVDSKILFDSFSCGIKHREILSDSCKQPLPINPFGIVAYAFTDNLSGNSLTRSSLGDVGSSRML